MEMRRRKEGSGNEKKEGGREMGMRRRKEGSGNEEKKREKRTASKVDSHCLQTLTNADVRGLASLLREEEVAHKNT
ncbi:hypothetical protein L345_08116, partial [Ophiophagus hannah]